MTMISQLNTCGQVAVWGIGYLGYTTLLRCHRFGLKTHVWAPEGDHLALLRQGLYPPREIQMAWSEIGSVPALDLRQAVICDSPEEVLKKEISVHIVALPNTTAKGENGHRVWHEIAGVLRRHASKDRPILILLMSAPIPGDTVLFLNALGEVNRWARVVSAFRSDWVVEDYLYRPAIQALGGDDDALKWGKAFLDRLEVDTFRIGSHHDAELYQAALGSFDCLVSAFVNQLSFAYPENDIRRIAAAVLRSCQLRRIRPTIGIGGEQVMTGVEHLFRGSDYNELLSIMKEAQAFNLSSILSYADFLARRGVRRVGILGITPQADNRNLAYSPSLLLAEALIKRRMRVFVHDPYFTNTTIRELLSGVELLRLDEPAEAWPLDAGDAVVLMTPHRHYREMNQKDMEKRICRHPGLVIDNTGLWQRFAFPCHTHYHYVGSGTVNVNG
ncbi:MAG: UDP-glucose/GDP-mannose dehydrogenase family protein [Pseudomonadota bacterium]